MTPTQHETIRRLHLRAGGARHRDRLNVSVADALELLTAAAAADNPRLMFVGLEAGNIIELLNRIWSAEAAANRSAQYAAHTSAVTIAECDAAALAESA